MDVKYIIIVTASKLHLQCPRHLERVQRWRNRGGGKRSFYLQRVKICPRVCPQDRKPISDYYQIKSLKGLDDGLVEASITSTYEWNRMRLKTQRPTKRPKPILMDKGQRRSAMVRID